MLGLHGSDLFRGVHPQSAYMLLLNSRCNIIDMDFYWALQIALYSMLAKSHVDLKRKGTGDWPKLDWGVASYSAKLFRASIVL